MSCCCKNKNTNFFSRPFDEDCCDRRNDRRDDCMDCGCRRRNNDMTGISCPFHNNNDCECAHSLREAAHALTNQRVIVHVNGCKMCVVIVDIGCSFIKAINPCTHRIVYFNIARIDNIEDVLPRCF